MWVLHHTQEIMVDKNLQSRGSKGDGRTVAPVKTLLIGNISSTRGHLCTSCSHHAQLWTWCRCSSCEPSVVASVLHAAESRSCAAADLHDRTVRLLERLTPLVIPARQWPAAARWFTGPAAVQQGGTASAPRGDGNATADALRPPTCPEQCTPAPMPMVGTCSAAVMAAATGGGTHSTTTAKQPASCSARACWTTWRPPWSEGGQRRKGDAWRRSMVRVRLPLATECCGLHHCPCFPALWWTMSVTSSRCADHCSSRPKSHVPVCEAHA